MNYSINMHRAIEAATLVHKGQERKSPFGVPFVSHCFAVERLVEQYYDDEDVLIAALLHDAREDNLEIGETIVRLFSPRVWVFVDYVTEKKYDENGDKIKWEIRKEQYAARLKDAPHEAKAISAADKIHNIRSILMAIDDGIDIWSLMTTTIEPQIERYDLLYDALSFGWQHPLLDGFKETLEMLRGKEN